MDEKKIIIPDGRIEDSITFPDICHRMIVGEVARKMGIQAVVHLCPQSKVVITGTYDEMLKVLRTTLRLVFMYEIKKYNSLKDTLTSNNCSVPDVLTNFINDLETDISAELDID